MTCSKPISPESPEAIRTAAINNLARRAVRAEEALRKLAVRTRIIDSQAWRRCALCRHQWRNTHGSINTPERHAANCILAGSVPSEEGSGGSK